MSEINKREVDENKVVDPVVGDYASRKREVGSLIEYALQKITMSGAGGAERDAIMNISRELESDQISPEIAKTKISDMGFAVTEAESSPEKSMDKKREAHDYIFGILHQMAVRGANDVEYPAIREITDKLDAGEITPEEAKKMARDLEDNKQDYR